MKKFLILVLFIALSGCHRQEIIIEDPPAKQNNPICKQLVSDLEKKLQETTALFVKQEDIGYASTQVESWECAEKDSAIITVLLTMEVSEVQDVLEKGACLVTIRTSSSFPIITKRYKETGKVRLVDVGNVVVKNVEIVGMECAEAK